LSSGTVCRRRQSHFPVGLDSINGGRRIFLGPHVADVNDAGFRIDGDSQRDFGGLGKAAGRDKHLALPLASIRQTWSTSVTKSQFWNAAIPIGSRMPVTKGTALSFFDDRDPAAGLVLFFAESGDVDFPPGADGKPQWDASIP